MSSDAQQNSSPTKSWVQFNDDDGDATKAGTNVSSPGGSSSGVSSVRGSVNSVSQHEGAGASIDVSDIQVVDEHSLRKKSLANNKVNDSLDSVNLSGGGGDIQGQQHEGATTPASAVIRGKQFSPDKRATEPEKVFHNGEVIVTLLPVNERFPWVTPARFRPELVPEELMAPVLTLTVEEYVQTMEKLTTDMRFTVYNICYKRILMIWIITAFTILLSLLFSGFKGVELFASGVIWLIMNASAIFFCMWIKLKLSKQLERCMSSVNSGLLKHNIILGLDDRGKLSCHKVNLCFIYFNPTECIKKLESLLAEKPDESTANGAIFDRDSYLREVERFEDVEVVVAGRNNVKLDRKQERAEKLFLHYVQRWAKDYLRRRLDWIVEDVYGRTEYVSNTNPRHIRSALCPCQYIEEHLKNKRQAESLNPCTLGKNPCHWCD